MTPVDNERGEVVEPCMPGTVRPRCVLIKGHEGDHRWDGRGDMPGPTLDDLRRWKAQIRAVLIDMEETFPERGPGCHDPEALSLTFSAQQAVQRAIRSREQEDCFRDA